jgi:hypothetical protein
MSRIFELLRQAKLDAELLQNSVATTAAANSRNFELLQQDRKDELLFDDVKSPAITSTELDLPRPAVYSGSGETFKLVQRIFLADAVLAPRVVVFCPVEARNADNWICVQAADLLANNVQDSSVCLVDANLPHPSLHNYFEVENFGGLAGAMTETGPVVGFTQSVDRGHLRLMSAGVISASADADSVLDSGRLRARMSELRAKFDYILIDAPPATSGFPTGLLARLVDGFILLVEPGFTPRQAAREAKDNIEAAGGRVLGVVLHRRELPFGPRTEQRQRRLKRAKNS